MVALAGLLFISMPELRAITRITSVIETTPIALSLSSITHTRCDLVASNLAIANPKVVSRRTSNTGNRSYKNHKQSVGMTSELCDSLYSLPVHRQCLAVYEQDLQIGSMSSITIDGDNSASHATRIKALS